MEKINTFSKNELISSKGIMGRHEYSKLILFLILAMLFIFFIISSIFFSTDASSPGSTVSLWFISYLFCGYIAIVNSFKRIRDIRGGSEDELPYQVGVVVLLLIPYVNLATLAALCLMKGSITEDSKTYTNIASGLKKSFTSQGEDKISNLTQLHELKQKGVLDENEYLRLKNEILNKK